MPLQLNADSYNPRHVMPLQLNTDSYNPHHVIRYFVFREVRVFCER
jgi:hypothetical protein